MESDLQKAKALLAAHAYTCVLCREEQLVTSCHRGVRPLLELLDSGKSYVNFSAADKVVGRATAFLYCLLGVRAVHSVVLSDSAAEVFTSCGILFSCDTRVPGIRNRDNTGPCPMEQATQGITDPAQALEAIRQTLSALEKII